MELLQAGVDRAFIAIWLGHESVETTQIYLDANLALKEEILGKTNRFGHTRGATVLGIACSTSLKDFKRLNQLGAVWSIPPVQATGRSWPPEGTSPVY